MPSIEAHTIGDLAQNTERLYRLQLRDLRITADRAVACILLGQWIFAICCALFISPLAWDAEQSFVHVHVYAAVGIGALLTVVPIAYVWLAPGATVTRWVTTSAQVLFSGLLIHLMGGRIEAHFHIFGSLALIAAYQDRLLFIPGVVIITIDHLIRGMLWPESVFGTTMMSAMRAFEHAGWVLFCSVFLLWGVTQTLKLLRKSAELQASLTEERDLLETRVEDRTREIEHQRYIHAAVMQTIPASVFWRDADDCFLGCNDTCAEFLGLESRQEIVGKSNQEVSYIADRITNEESCFQLRSPDELPRFSVEESLTHSDGRRLTVLSSVSPLQDSEGRVFGTLGMFHDVNDLKQAQAHATGLAQVIRESPSEIYIFDAESFRIVEANMGVCDNLGYSRNELLSMTPLDFSQGIDEYELRNALNEAIDNDTLKCCFNAYHARRDGTSYPVQIDAHWAAFENKWVYVAFVKDLTEYQAMQRQLTQAQKLESMGHMAAGIAHEINTPMQCVSGNVEFLMGSYERLFKLTDQLIALARDPQVSPALRAEQVDKILEESRYGRIQQNTPDAISDASIAVQRVIEIVRAMKSMAHPGHRKCAEMDVNDLLEKATVISRNRWKYVAELEMELDEDLLVYKGSPQNSVRSLRTSWSTRLMRSPRLLTKTKLV